MPAIRLASPAACRAASLAASLARVLVALAAPVACSAPGAFAGERIDMAARLTSALDAVEAQVVRPLAADPEVIAAVAAANADRLPLDQPEIERLDRQWRAEIGRQDRATIAAMLAAPLSARLRDRVKADPRIAEILVTDNRGLNVALSAATSDFWQGDEPKFLVPFAAGPDGILRGAVEYDESSHRFVVQISATVADPATAAPVGTITVSVDAAAL
ncbi:hypothetical protein [Frigidibacter oleivorans]|uniref:hypothetical protein n=1 Tax=Frigidibacter oleivorans TaxID=2487129 RepID=UPI001F2BC498|nr:hypothetical protein [Frigidibacter oleivorans]